MTVNIYLDRPYITSLDVTKEMLLH